MTDSSSMTPREIVAELDRHIVGQHAAKRAVAIALRNRWRRAQLAPELRNEVMPKNILMIGPTGVGKTEISRRLAKLAGAPFVKVEATKFTEVGYVGRDVEQIVRDLVEVGIGLVREKKRAEVTAKAHMNAEERVLDALVGATASPATRDSFRKKLRNNELDALTISSSEGLRNLLALLDTEALEDLNFLPLFVPHRRIAEVAAELGLFNVVLTGPADAGILESLCSYPWPRHERHP